MFDLTQLTQSELIQGYHQHNQLLLCNYCQITFSDQQTEAMQAHLTTIHGGSKQALLTVASKYSGLTDTQVQLLTAFSTADKDQAVADDLEVSASTVRHQKFTFREKAKSAELYLAQYHAIFGDVPVKANQYLPIPPAITHPDDRYRLTEQEYVDLISKYFAPDQTHLVLKRWPKGEKKLFGLLTRISQEFELGHRYSLQETDTLLKTIYADYSMMKRYLIDDGFLDRTADGRQYWRIF